MNIKKIIFFFLLPFLSFSCTPEISNIDRLSSHEPMLKTSREYESYLALEYLAFSRNLVSIKDKKNAEYFAKKGLDVISQKDVVPENPIIWKADPTQIEEMVLMQKRMEIVLTTPHMKFHLPIQLAHLTYLYDCWISRESSPIFRAEELAKCRTRFHKLIDEIEYYIEDLKRNKLPEVTIREPEFKRFPIYFDLNNTKLNDLASKDLIEVLKYIESLKGDYKILVIGNADRSASKIYNQTLAFKRAKIIENHLIKSGVHQDFITARSAGESFPDIITKDGVQNQLNRSVVIYVLNGFGSFMDYPVPLIENIIYRDEVKRARQERGLTN